MTTTKATPTARKSTRGRRPLVGWHYFPNGARPDYYVRQLRDWKGSLEISTLDPKALAIYAG